MRWRPCKRRAEPDERPRPGTTGTTPPLPDNPYRRFYTPTPTFEDLVRRKKQQAEDSQ